MNTEKQKSAQTICFTIAHVLPSQKQKQKDDFYGKNPSENETAFAIAGPPAPVTVQPLCVFLCMPLFDLPIRTQ